MSTAYIFCTFQILKDRLDRLYELKGQGDSSIPDSALAPGDVTMAVAETLKDHPDPISEIRSMSFFVDFGVFCLKLPDVSPNWIQRSGYIYTLSFTKGLISHIFFPIVL